MWSENPFSSAPWSTATTPTPASADMPETLAPSESFLKQVDRIFAEAVALSEARLLSVGRTIGDTLGLAEGFSAVKQFFSTIGDTLGLTETFTKSVEKARSETVVLTEQLGTQVEGPAGGGVATLPTFVALYVGLRL